VVEGDDHCEAYTTIVQGELLSRERYYAAEAEAVDRAEGNMCGPVMRGSIAQPWSKTHVQREDVGTWEISRLAGQFVSHWSATGR
jgi:hypothetical protein